MSDSEKGSSKHLSKDTVDANITVHCDHEHDHAHVPRPVIHTDASNCWDGDHCHGESKPSSVNQSEKGSSKHDRVDTVHCDHEHDHAHVPRPVIHTDTSNCWDGDHCHGESKPSSVNQSEKGSSKHDRIDTVHCDHEHDHAHVPRPVIHTDASNCCDGDHCHGESKPSSVNQSEKGSSKHDRVDTVHCDHEHDHAHVPRPVIHTDASNCCDGDHCHGESKPSSVNQSEKGSSKHDRVDTVHCDHEHDHAHVPRPVIHMDASNCCDGDHCHGESKPVSVNQPYTHSHYHKSSSCCGDKLKHCQVPNSEVKSSSCCANKRVHLASQLKFSSCCSGDDCLDDIPLSQVKLNSCCIGNDLSENSPTSPMISNSCCNNVDQCVDVAMNQIKSSNFCDSYVRCDETPMSRVKSDSRCSADDSSEYTPMSTPMSQLNTNSCCNRLDCCDDTPMSHCLPEPCCTNDDCCDVIPLSTSKICGSGGSSTNSYSPQTQLVTTHTHTSSCTHELQHTPMNFVGPQSDEYSIIINEEVTIIDVVVQNICDMLCTACDPNSEVPHTIKVSRFRVANLCCAGEEKIVRSSLEGMIGIENIAVNIIGRYVVIKHCTVSCCAPGDKIVEILNSKHLGASIQEAAGGGENGKEDLDWIRIGHLSLVFVLFILGIIFQFMPSLEAASIGTYLASTLIGILPILYSSYITILRKTVDIHILMTIAVAGAIAGKEYFDAALVVFLFVTAELIESIAMMKVRQAINSSSTAMPKEAYLCSGSKIKVEDLKVGHVLAVRAGEMILGDGIVVKGEGVVDESALTGESVPITKKRGAKVLSGTVVQNGFMEIELDTDYADSTMNRLNQEVADVQADRGEYAKFVDRFSVYWTPGVIVATVVFVVVGGGVTSNWNDYVFRGLVLLVLACPCAIVIAAPIPSVCAIAVAAKNGILIRGSSVIERMGIVDTVALDKTGTLTKGFFKVGNSISLCDETDRDYDPMQLAAAIEQKSTHPLANAVVAAHCGCVADMIESDVQMPNVRRIIVEDGVGVSGWAESEPDFWQHVAIGNERLLKANGGKVRVSPRQQQLIDDFNAQSHGKVVLFVAIDDQLELMLSLSDELRAESAEFVSIMQRMKMTVSMLTGDQEQVATDVCREVGIANSDCNFRMLPHDKLDWIQVKQKGTAHSKASSKVMMVGDGINDSIALTAAHVGVAMGAGGSAMAVASADLILMTDNLLLLPFAVRLCQLACSITIQNFTFAILVKVVAIVLALMGHLAFWQAVLVDMGTLLVVLGNGIRPLFVTNFLSKSKNN